MSDKVYYKVLLVDDDEKFSVSLQHRADTYYGLDLLLCKCWEEAQKELSNKNKFLEWDAIILDANCVYKKGELADLGFLTLALGELRELFGLYGSSIPWYVLTAGAGEKVDKKDFNSTMTTIMRYPRDDESWGERLFFKNDIDEGKLCQTIIEVAPKRTRNKIKHQYREVFDAMENYLSGDDKNVMIEILTALHFPETRKDFDADKEYSRLRTILENVFRHANKIGLLPDELLHNDGRPNLNEASLYMAGKAAGKDSKLIQFRYGEEKEYIFPPIIATTVKNFIAATSDGTHLTVHQANLLFGYALQLCDVIVWFCDYAKSHNDREANLAKCRVVKKETESKQGKKPIIEEYEGKTFPLEYDKENHVFHCGYCLLLSKSQKLENIGKMVKLSNVVENTDKNYPKYKNFAKKVEVIESE